MSTAVDFAARLIDPAAIKAAGHSAVLVYVSPSRPGSNFGAKPVTKEYTDRLKAAGLEVVSIWQYGKPGNATPSDWTTGRVGGYRMGGEAVVNHFRAGGAGYAPIYFAVDEDLSLDDWNNTAVHFFRGVNDAIGREWTGIYGSAKVCAWAIEDQVVGRTSEGRYWAWQTRAWSQNVLLDTQATLYQRVIDTPTNPGPQIDGSSVDVNDIWAADYGQWSIDRTPAQGETSVATKPTFTELERFGNSAQSRGGARITNFLLHTQEGNGTAESLAGYLNNSANGVSYHYTLRDGIVCDVVDTDLASWSVGNANSSTINLCFAGSFASWSRDEWLNRDTDLRIAAWLAVQDAKKYGFSTDVIGRDYSTRRDGISDHEYVTRVIGWGSHTDCGPGFPWDVFADFVDEYANSGSIPTKPQPNAINDAAARADWLGDRITVGENATPDGKGRYAQFRNGYVYWHPSHGAHAMPMGIFNKWALLKWESGFLGWPILDVAALEEGQAQAFQGGILYHKRDNGVFAVHGAIGQHWTKSGFEKGPLGWPTSDEYDHDGGKAQDFERGTVYWSPTGIVAINKG